MTILWVVCAVWVAGLSMFVGLRLRATRRRGGELASVYPFPRQAETIAKVKAVGAGARLAVPDGTAASSGSTVAAAGSPR
jgi:hypothetical protein